MIKNRNTVWSKDSCTEGLQLPKFATADLPTASTSNRGCLVHDTTTNTPKYSNAASWGEIGLAASAHAMLSSTHSDSTVGTCTRGDIIVAQGATPTWTRLAKGTQTYYLVMGANEPAWTALTFTQGALTTGSILIGASSMAAALDVKGDGKIIVGNGTTATSVSVSGVITLANDGSTAFAAGAIVNADINATAGITVGKVALTTGSMILGAANVGSALDVKGDGKIIVGNGTTATSVSVGGVITLANNGTTAFAAGAIVNADVNASAAVVESKLAFDASGGHDHNGVNSKLVSAGIASNLANNVTCEAGANDYTLAFGAAGGAYTLTVPVVGGSRTFSFINEDEAITGEKTITSGKLHIADSAAPTRSLIIAHTNTGIAADKTLTIDTNNVDCTLDTNGNVSFGGAISVAGTLTTAGNWTHTGAHTFDLVTNGNLNFTSAGAGTVTFPTGSWTSAGLSLNNTFSGNQTMQYGKLYLGDNDNGQTLQILINENMTGDKTLTIKPNDGNREISLTGNLTLSSNFTTTGNFTTSLTQSANVTLALPGANTTLVGHDQAQTLTNKTIDVDSNTVSNINANELDPVGNAAYAVPFVAQATYAALAAAGSNVIGTSHPKLRVIDFWVLHTTADAGTICLHSGQVGALGNAITDVITVAAGDKDITHAGEIDDAEMTVAANTGLAVVGDGGASIDGIAYVLCIPVD